MNLDEIQQTIPNRPPYLWVDEVVSLDREQIHTRKHLNPELPVFAAHYPDFPVFPAAPRCFDGGESPCRGPCKQLEISKDGPPGRFARCACFA
jgi:hypothetical protein